ncbi:alpha/beta fold hydrolase [Agromyces mangrovi Wang et al. 2018]|uniref:alpha/beta fold hydrolase n=1 Tax=Agromyces mangrovi TaxID=1858653 RepID=UPI0025734451|nr:alpha/beta hydrolase [Agromyces mangrovi]BDZ65538.1 alpha/beta hydrolase [Agromyces mangrovi]
MIHSFDVPLPDGGVLRAHDSRADASDGPALAWHHGSPQTGAPLEPVLAAAAARGLRVISYARPSYGGSSARPGRDVASAAGDLAAVADVLGIDAIVSMGASGGGPHALAGAALRPDLVRAVVTLAGIAPFTDAFDWYDGMASPGGLRAAARGRDARAAFAETEEFDPSQFVAADYAALEGGWAALGVDVGRSEAFGDDGLIDDDVAFATSWGFELDSIEAPVLVVQGGLDRVVPPAHGAHLAAELPNAELWVRPHDGHVSVLDAVPEAMDRVLAMLG